NRLGANSLLSSIYGGMVAGPNAVDYINGLESTVEDLSSSLFEKHQQEEQAKQDAIMKMDGTENAYQIHKELGEWMTANV
ncbi:succinate dehydrogenase flavoprotein subunit, partial [Staphylococcus sp. SIMBA_130]